MHQVDLAVEPFEAFRIFRLETRNSTLTSLAYTDAWMPGEIMVSECKKAGRHHGHIKPAMKCSCGIWAVKSRKGISMTYPNLARQNMIMHERKEKPPIELQSAGGKTFLFSSIGPVSDPELFLSARVHLWGTVIEHQWGYRAEFAKILPETLTWFPRRGRFFKPKLLQHIKEKYLDGEIARVFGDGGEQNHPEYTE